MGDSHCICCCRCISFVILLGLTTLFSWLAVRPNGPTISVTAIYMPALNRTSGEYRRNATARNNTIAVDIRLVNPNKDSGIHYDGLNVSLYFKDSGKLVGGAPIPAFYQGKQKKAQKQAAFNGTGDGWEAVFREGSNGMLVFRVVLGTLVRYKVMAWNTGRHSGEYVGEVLLARFQGLPFC
ncbi:NDR1 protein [Nymphaea thermarum]|nr:NDR1 protein [Nymphaea thermarum]